MQGYTKFLDALEKIIKIILVVTVSIMVLVMMYQVILRYVFSAANTWSEELTRYLFILNVMLAAVIAIRKNSHLQIDIILNIMKPRTKTIFTICSNIVAVAFLVGLLVYSARLCVLTAANISAGLGISMSIPYAAIPLGAFLMILASFEVIGNNIKELKTGEVNEE